MVGDLDRGWMLLPTHHFLAFRGQPLTTLKQCTLAVVIARASSASSALPRSNHKPLIRQISREVKELYFPNHTPKMAGCIMTRSATWAIYFPGPVQRALGKYVVGQPVLFVLHGIEGLSTRINKWHDCSAHSPQLAIHIAISMPSADLPYVLQRAWSPAFNISRDEDGVSDN